MGDLKMMMMKRILKKNLRTMRPMKYRKMMIHQWKFKIIKLLKGIERNQKKRMKKSLIIIKYKKKEKNKKEEDCVKEKKIKKIKKKKKKRKTRSVEDTVDAGGGEKWDNALDYTMA